MPQIRGGCNNLREGVVDIVAYLLSLPVLALRRDVVTYESSVCFLQVVERHLHRLGLIVGLVNQVHNIGLAIERGL